MPRRRGRDSRGHPRRNGDPGWRTLGQGWRRLIDAEAGVELAEAIRAKK